LSQIRPLRSALATRLHHPCVLSSLPYLLIPLSLLNSFYELETQLTSLVSPSPPSSHPLLHLDSKSLSSLETNLSVPVEQTRNPPSIEFERTRSQATRRPSLLERENRNFKSRSSFQPKDSSLSISSRERLPGSTNILEVSTTSLVHEVSLERASVGARRIRAGGLSRRRCLQLG